MPVLGRYFHKVWLTALACLVGATAAVAGPDAKPTPRDQDRAAPSSLALPARLMVWPSLPKLSLWWHGAQAAGQPAGQPAQPAPAQPAPAPTPEQAPAEPAPAEPAPEPAPAEPAPAPSASPAQPAGDTPTDADVIAQAEAELEGGGDQEGEVIVVTGSAIERKETTTPAPVSVVDREELDASGLVAVGDILQNLPSQSNGINVQFNNGGDGSTRVDLRGLGAERTLVLINGRRHVNGGLGANASVDLNAIPLAVIKRVEVLKDGASAVYGSDALGGVVNIITRDDFDGAEANLYTGTSQRGDGTVLDASFVAGQASKRGNVVFSGGYSDQQPIFAGDRDFAEVAYTYDFATGEPATSGSPTTPNGRVGFNQAEADAYAAANGGASLCPGFTMVGAACTPDGSTATGFRDFSADGASDRNAGDLYNFQPENYLAAPLRRYNVFSTGNYRFHDNVRGFFEASYMNRKSIQRLAPEPLSTGTEGIPFSAQSVYNPTGIDLSNVSRRMLEAGPRKFSQSIDTFRVVTGFDGTIPQAVVEGWKWEASFNYGRTQGTDTNGGRLVRDRVRQAIGPSYFDENNVARCGTPENPGAEDCVPLNLLGGENTITKEMLDYITYTGIAEGFTQQRSWNGGLSGPLFKTPWNGDVVLAMGGGYREEKGGDQPDPITAAGNTTGNKEEPTLGGYDVVEGFGELSIVPITGEDWAKWLEVNLAGRVVDYSSFGNKFTWKAGGLWRFAGGVAVRGTYSTAFRAPSIGELYEGEGDSFQNTSDICGGQPTDPVIRANCEADINNYTNEDGMIVFDDTRSQLPTRVGGNPNVTAETAKVYTGGVVYEPEFAEGLGLSVDYFNITIDDALQQATASVLMGNCYSLEDRSDCDKITRDPATGEIVSIIDVEQNIGSLETDGIDFNINYEHAYPQIGRFRHNLEGTWLRNYTAVFPSRTVEALGVYDLEAVFPRWKVNLTTMWGFKGLTLGANARYIHKIRECEDNNCQAEAESAMLDREVDANITGDVFTSYALKSPAGTTTLTLGVNNITDQEPPVIYNGFLAASDAAAYDYAGRFLYARLSQLF
jgi:iron complex outermembrane receptor protein